MGKGGNRLTNGFVEGKNNRTKPRQRQAYGYRTCRCASYSLRRDFPPGRTKTHTWASSAPTLLLQQNVRMALAVAQRGYVLQTGEVVLQDTAANLQRNEMVRKVYLGEA